MLKFAILKIVTGRDPGTVIALEYDSDQLKSKLSTRVRDYLSAKDSFWSKKYSKEEVIEAVGGAFDAVVNEIKQETITLV